MALPPPTSQRGSHSSAKDLDASMATVVIVVACASAAAFALHAALRLLLRRLRTRRPSDKPAEGAMTTTTPPQLLPGSVLFAAGATAVAGATECAICLAELAEGERVRVMPACGHGFHAHCVDAWLVSRSSSCPTCRTEWWPADEEAAVEA